MYCHRRSTCITKEQSRHLNNPCFSFTSHTNLPTTLSGHDRRLTLTFWSSSCSSSQTRTPLLLPPPAPCRMEQALPRFTCCCCCSCFHGFPTDAIDQGPLHSDREFCQSISSVRSLNSTNRYGLPQRCDVAWYERRNQRCIFQPSAAKCYRLEPRMPPTTTVPTHEHSICITFYSTSATRR